MPQEKFLFEKIEAIEEGGFLSDLPPVILPSLSPKIVLRDYQDKAFRYFATYYESQNLHKNKQIHTLFHMATGSGKTVIMAGLILYLYSKGYRKFLFFVNQSNIVDKTKDNFIEQASPKYLFSDTIKYLGEHVKIHKVNKFSDHQIDDVEICFSTVQKLHLDLMLPHEDTITYSDFENDKIVFIADESHHINSLTKKESKEEEEMRNSWEYSVMNAFASNKDNVLLEFTATCDLNDRNVRAKYLDKIIFDYPLKKFRESGYTKDFQNFATESELWDRTLMAIIISEYRKFLFADLKLNIKPVVMFKSQKIAESKDFYNYFFEKMSELNSGEIRKFSSSNIDLLKEAITYFSSKDASLDLLVQSIKISFTKETTIIMNETTDNNEDKQRLVNTLEEKDNPIRAIFTVDMLNEGWDVLNLFDIVRLYDTRQGSGVAGKIGNYTLKEAQLIGRGARYCPFDLHNEQDPFKRKYDNDLTNQYRILETMLFHSRNDSKYIAELKQALVFTGMQDPEPIKLDYVVKDDFKDTDFYKKGFVASNTRMVKSRDNIFDIEGRMKTKKYTYTAKSNMGQIHALMEDASTGSVSTHLKTLRFKEIDYNVLSGAAERFIELRFNVIKEKYPNVKSLKEFLTSDNYLGNSFIEITYFDTLRTIDVRDACVKALAEVSKHIADLKPEFEGSKVFRLIPLKTVVKNKSIYLSKIETSGGKGDSQTFCSNPNYRLNLQNEKWYVFNDNYGTSEEKLFIKFFKSYIAPKLDSKNLEYYVIRNERVPELAVYSFEHGERFEPDFLLFVRKKTFSSITTHQVYAEPKGDNLLEEDKWKEEFLNQMADVASVDQSLLSGEYKIFGLPFFNENNRLNEITEAINKWVDSL